MAGRQIAEAEISGANTDKTFHFVTDFVEHTTNLSIDALTQDDVQTCGRE